MPIVFAPLVAFALGVALAWTAAPELMRCRRPVVSSRPFLVVAAFTGLVWLPVVGYFVVFHGDWSYLYVAPWQIVPSAVDLALVLAATIALVGGFLLAVPPIRRRRFGIVAAMAMIPASAALAGFALAARRLAVSGTYAQFHGDFGTEPIGASTLGKGVLLMGVVLVLAVAWSVRALLRMGG